MTTWGLWLHGIRPVPELVDLAVASEEAGASTLLLADEGTDRDLYVVLTAIAAATSRITLVPGITNPFSRHPVATAAALASLDEVAPGRIVAGLGAGGSRVLGPMAYPSTRAYSALVECVDVVEQLLRGDTVTHCGEFGVDRATLSWSPRRIPIGIAGRGPRVQQLAAERAEWIILSGKRLTSVGDLVAEVHAVARAAGRPGPRVIWNPGALWTQAAIDAARPRYTYMSVDMPSADRARLGITDESVSEIRRLLLEGGPDAAARLVPDAVIRDYAIAGTLDEVVERLRLAVDDVRPDVVAFDVHDYEPSFAGEVAALCAEAGIARADVPPAEARR